MTRIHPLTGESRNGKANGKPRPEVSAFFSTPFQQQRMQASYDAARSGTDLDNHWAFSDSLDADSANNQHVRHTLAKRSRYESGSNGYYSGILYTHCNMLVGVGPTLRMLTGNRDFNQLVEREFYAWAQEIHLHRKLWSMCWARFGDGECLGVMQNNPAFRNVQLDLMPIEGEQCQSPFTDVQMGKIDGILQDQYGNVVGYEILPFHPGSGTAYLATKPELVSAADVVHWFKLRRPGGHRGVPDMTPTLQLGAYSRRFREATTAAAETAADLAAISTTQHSAAGADEPDMVAPFTGVPLPKRTWAFNPAGWDVHQMKAEHPGTTYDMFVRQQTAETASPIAMPYNLAAHDSSTYSFASGKLDTLAYRAALDVERQDCNTLVLDKLFAAWFREWTIIASRRDIPPAHQWDWPAHPVIDEVAHSKAVSTNLSIGVLTHRQAFSDQGDDYEDQLVIMAEDWFGEASEENIAKARQINVLRTTPAHAIQYVAQLMGIQSAQPAEAANDFA